MSFPLDIRGTENPVRVMTTLLDMPFMENSAFVEGRLIRKYTVSIPMMATEGVMTKIKNLVRNGCVFQKLKDLQLCKY
ncbi:hypothetical protein GL2_08540 [Microbulbifer sp. GL-2]|nr:hypothetical protein GL2_08540 [Microbulbifer sp. GL-2]